MKKPRALVVDDEPDIRELLNITLERMNLEVIAADTINVATRELRANPFDLCLTDMRLPDGDGLGLVEWIQTHKPQTPVAVITAHGNVELGEAGAHAHAHASSNCFAAWAAASSPAFC